MSALLNYKLQESRKLCLAFLPVAFLGPITVLALAGTQQMLVDEPSV